MPTTVAGRSGEFTGLRPFNPLRDVRPMTELLELSFGQDLDAESRQMLREMRATAPVVGPLLWLLGTVPSRWTFLFKGFVWVDEGRGVGNVNVHRGYGEKKGWFISNLAVDPDHRRQGIARRLMTHSIEFVKKRGARRLSLEVRAGNLAAKKLYDTLGFSTVDSVSKMRLDELPVVNSVPCSAFQIAMVEPGDWQKKYRLAQDAFTAEAREITPVEEREYRLNRAQLLLSRVSDFLKGQEVHQWAALADGAFLALLRLRTGSSLFPHFVELTVHPHHRGGVEEPLLATALATLDPYPSRPVLARIRPSYAEAMDAFKRYGFVEERTLDLLTLRL